MNKATLLEICERLKAAKSKREQSGIARELLAAANTMGDKLTGELCDQVVAALEPVTDLTDWRANAINDLNEQLRNEYDLEKRYGILTAMMRIRNTKTAAQ